MSQNEYAGRSEAGMAGEGDKAKAAPAAAMRLSTQHTAEMNGHYAGLGDKVNEALSLGIPGLTWQQILLKGVQLGGKLLMQWLNQVIDSGGSNMSDPVPPPPHG